MDKAHLSAILTTAGAVDTDGWWTVPDGKSITLYAARQGVSLSVSRAIAVKDASGVLHARTAKGETYVLAMDDVFAGSVDGTAVTARKAGFGI